MLTIPELKVKTNQYQESDTIKKALQTDNQQNSIFTHALLTSDLRNCRYFLHLSFLINEVKGWRR